MSLYCLLALVSVNNCAHVNQESCPDYIHPVEVHLTVQYSMHSMWWALLSTCAIRFSPSQTGVSTV